MVCRGIQRGKNQKGGCTRGDDCVGHGLIDCQICGWPIAEHQLPKWGYCTIPPSLWREPRPARIAKGSRAYA